MKHFSKVIDCTQQLQVRENVVEFEKALRAVKVIKDQIQYRSQSLHNLARGYFMKEFHIASQTLKNCLRLLLTEQHWKKVKNSTVCENNQKLVEF